MKVIDKARNPVATKNRINSSKDKPGDSAANVVENVIKQPKLARNLACFGMWSTVSERWSQLFAREQQLIFSLLGMFIGLFICCACYVVKSLWWFEATHKVLFLLQARLMAVFPLWYALGFFSLFSLAAFFAALFEHAKVSRQLAVSAPVFFLCFTGVSFWCSQSSSVLRRLGDAESSSVMFSFAPPIVCILALLWGWQATWFNETSKTTKGDGSQS